MAAVASETFGRVVDAEFNVGLIAVEKRDSDGNSLENDVATWIEVFVG